MWIIDFIASLDGWQRFNAAVILAASLFVVAVAIKLAVGR